MRTPLAAAVILTALAAAPVARAEPVVALRLGIAPAVGSATAGVPVSEALTVPGPGPGGRALARRASVGGGLRLVGPRALRSLRRRLVRRVGRPARGRGALELRAARGRRAVGGARGRVRVGEREPRAQRGHGSRRAGAGPSSSRRRAASSGVSGAGSRVGPFLLLGAGRYTRLALDTGLDSASADVARKAVHAWFHDRRPRPARARADAMNGTLLELEVDSPALAGNPLGDPARRPVLAYVPPGGAAPGSRRLLPARVHGQRARLDERRRCSRPPSPSGSTRSSRRARSRRSSASSRTA